MKIHYLMASMLACLFCLNSCGSDGDEPTPDKPGGKGASKLVVNVESPGTFKQTLEKKLPECVFISEIDHCYRIDTLVIEGIINAADIHILHNYKDVFTNPEMGWYYMSIVLDLSNTQIAGSDYNGKNYKANHLYPVNGNSFGKNFTVIKYPQNIEVIETGALRWAEIYDRSILTREELQEVGDSAFHYATIYDSQKPLDLEFSKNLKKIGEEAYSGFEYQVGATIRSLKISHDITIGNRAFAHSAFSNSINTIDLKGMERISDGAFRDFNRYGNTVIVSMPDVKYIGNSAFSNVTRTVNPEDLKNLIEIGDSAFYYGSQGKPIDISKANQLTKIGKMAFGASGFTYIEDIPTIIPLNVKEIGSSAFNHYWSSTIHMKCKTPPIYKSHDKNDRLFGKICNTLYVPKGCKKIYMEGAKEEGNTIVLTCGIHLSLSGEVIEE